MKNTPEQDALEKELAGKGADDGAGAGAGAGAAGGKKDDAGAGKAGDEGAGKAAAGKKGADEDPEVEVFGEKVKKSQYEAWKKSGMLEDDYRKKTETLAEQQKQVAALVELSDFLAKNPKKLQKVMAVLDEAEDAADKADASGKPKDKKDAAAAAQTAQEQIQAILDKIDPEDPAAALLKAMYAKMETMEKVVQGFHEKDKRIEAESQRQTQVEAVKTAQETLKGAFAELEKTLEFESDEEKGIWKGLVLSFIKDNPKNYDTKEDFVKAVTEAGKAQFKRVRAIAEAALKRHLEGSGKAPILPGAGGGGAAQPKKFTMENLEEVLEAELSAVNK